MRTFKNNWLSFLSLPGVQWTVVGSNYPRFELSPCQTNVSGGGGGGGMSSSGNHSNPNESQHSSSSASANSSAVSGNHSQQMHYQGGASSYPTQIISVNPNNLVNNYPPSLSTPTSPQDNKCGLVQSVYSQGPTPNQSPQQMANNTQTTSTGGGSGNASVSGTGAGGATTVVTKRKRSVNPQGDENFQRALEAVRFGGIGFCKAARMYGVNNRTLWLEYKKRGYPISRPSIKNRIKLEPNMTPPPTSSTPTNDENTSMETYEHMSQSSLNNMSVPPPSDTPTSLMCPPHAHPMGVMSFLDTRHVEFAPSIHPMSRQRFPDGAVNVNPTAMNLQGLNFNSM